MKAQGFRVIIVGGGIGGLALAISLQRAGIEYVLIEKGDRLDPQVGASIGILPNASRILDQLGCLEELNSLTVGMVTTATHKEDGSLIGHVSDVLRVMERRTGYPVIFIDRQLLLRTLANRVTDTHRVQLNTAVKSIEQYADKAVVHCSDGTQIEGDIVVGADGVHSLVRREMWRHADEIGQGEQFEKDKNAMSAEYKCLFGISNSIEGMEAGQTDRTYAKDVSTLSYVGKEGRVFWFVFIKMDKVYKPPDIPKFTKDDTDAEVERFGKLAFREAGTVTLADVYRAKVVCNLVAVEEAAYEHWSYGRLACLGDSIHKMTPNLGAGAASAIESAAVLSNALVSTVSASSKPTANEVQKAFSTYHEERELRINKTMGATNTLTRVQALQTKMAYVFTHFIAPRSDDYFAESFSNFVIGAPIVSHLPVPARSLQGTMPFNPKHGWGFEESKSKRFGRAWPLLALAIMACVPSSKLPDQLLNINPALGQLTLEEQPSAGRNFAFAIATLSTYALWLIEGTRLTQATHLARFPILFSLPLLGFGQQGIIPFYFFLLYLTLPIESFRAEDNRLTDLSYTYCVAPLILLLGFVPAFLKQMEISFTSPNNAKVLDFMTQSELLVPIAIPTIQYLFSRVLRPSTIRTDRLWAVRRDVVPIRLTTALLAGVSAVAWAMHLSSSGSGAAAGGNRGHGQSLITSMLETAVGSVLSKGHGITLTLSATFWLLLVLGDLRRAGMTTMSYVTMAISMLTTLVCMGPGATAVLGWQWREEILIHRKHRDAVVGNQAEPIKMD